MFVSQQIKERIEKELPYVLIYPGKIEIYAQRVCDAVDKIIQEYYDQGVVYGHDPCTWISSKKEDDTMTIQFHVEVCCSDSFEFCGSAWEDIKFNGRFRELKPRSRWTNFFEE